MYCAACLCIISYIPVELWFTFLTVTLQPVGIACRSWMYGGGYMGTPLKKEVESFTKNDREELLHGGVPVGLGSHEIHEIHEMSSLL